MNFTKKEQIINGILLGFLVLTTLNSAYFFLGILKLDVFKWLAFNACSLAAIAYLIFFAIYFIYKKVIWLTFALLPLYYYGTMGLFVMSWNEANIFAHVSHIIITLNLLSILYKLLKAKEYENLGKGLLIGILFFVPVIAIIQMYVQVHIGEFMQALQSM